jgi:hypothetical protein
MSTMNYKLQYITKLFQKTSKKAIENYVLTRLWHRLDNEDIKMVPQQYVNRHPNKYALTDVYFPQFKIHVEVNEPAHYKSKEKIIDDNKRKIEIEKRTGHKVYVVDCRKKLVEIHNDIDDIVDSINLSIKRLKLINEFKPWNADEERSPEYWKKRNSISVEDKVSLNNIEDICKLFDADFGKTKRGYLRLGGINLPTDEKILIWWPSETTRKGWVNKLDLINNTITETHEDIHKKYKHFNEYLNSTQKRYVFFHQKDVLGLTSYKFIGVFSYDSVRSCTKIGTVWKRTGDEITLTK